MQRGDEMNYNKLKGIMREKNYSQNKLAKQIGITTQSLNAKLNGRSQFTIEEAINIIAVLKIIKPEEIFFNNTVSNLQRT